MTLGARIAFAASLAANAVALYLLAPEPLPVVDAPPVALTVPASPRAAPSERGDVHAYFEALLARGLSREETKALVLARLLAESASANDPRTASEYWRSGYSVAAVEGVGLRVAAADRMRAELLAVYGPSARRDPLFESLFAPLDARYAFLASEQQLALQKLQLERLLAQAKSPAAAAAGPPPSSADGASLRASVTADALQDVRARLGSSAALEYAYRFSPLAEQLRSAAIDLSAAEFRSAFDALLQFETAAGDPRSFARTRESLRNMLGETRFTRLWAARDPYFGVIAAAGRKHGLADGMVLAAYAIFNDSQDRFAAAADRYAGVDPQSAGPELRRVHDDMRQRLAALVGEDAATALIRATARLSVSMQSPSSTNLRE